MDELLYMLDSRVDEEQSYALESVNGGIQWGRNSGMSSTIPLWHEGGRETGARL
jgi:hypothetical protein